MTTRLFLLHLISLHNLRRQMDEKNGNLDAWVFLTDRLLRVAAYFIFFNYPVALSSGVSRVGQFL